MAHWAFRVNLILVLILSDYRGPIYMRSNMTPWDGRFLIPLLYCLMVDKCT